MFALQGEYKIDRLGRILLIDAYGPWNRETAISFEADVREAAFRWANRTQWAMIATLHGEGVYTDESTPILKKLHAWRVANGLRHVAIVHGQGAPVSLPIPEYQIDEIYESEPTAGTATRYFEGEEDALAWLRELGYGDESSESSPGTAPVAASPGQ